ncbi:tetratricopeptide (TPR) repeat protein [Catenuloplanes nepalensis]|uniref:Tetratricopeptide (TPR) repeat protein n=1 Tax=Catenuloplanes nepalensis TaxID=587533 RepID=A0ABT9MS00_9ACTN|nr:tetratricopeptide repeat protein [Catenuloplanes nepalensis]MDP9794214.1 tetratricopeptide (TPR) repeat protein [Catenuloplanes nepalensis]
MGSAEFDPARAVEAQLVAALRVQMDNLMRYEQWIPDAPVSAVSLVDRYRVLAAGDPAYRPDLAGLLTTASRHLGSVGRETEALPPAEESVALHRELGDEPGLATALDNLAFRLTRSRRPAEASTALVEAVEIRRRLVAADPDRYRAALARSLFGFAAADPHGSAYHEGLVLLRESGDSDPGGVAKALMALDVLRAGQSGLDHDRVQAHVLLGEQASGPLESAEDRAGFVRNLRVVSLALAQAGSGEAAEVGFGLVLAVGRPLLADPAHAEDIVFSVARIAGARDRAATVALWEETIAWLRTTTGTEAALADALARLAQTFNGLARYAEALPPAQESVSLREHLGRADLALSLSTLATALAHLDRPAEAIAASGRSVLLSRHEVRDDPGLLGAALADASATLARAGRPKEALESAKESLQLYQALNVQTRGAYRQDVIFSLRDVATRYAEQGKNFRARMFAAQADALERS